MITTSPGTPESDKLAAFGDEFTTLSEFFEWASDQGYQFGRYTSVEGYLDEQFVPVSRSTHEVTLDFLGVNRDDLEAERRALVKHQRHMNSVRGT